MRGLFTHYGHPMATYSRRTAKDKLPKGLQPFTFHGMEFEPAGDNQGLATCPFCHKRKFYVNLDEPKGFCQVCKESLNPVQFVRKLWDAAKPDTDDLKALAEERGLVSHRVLEEWGVRKSPLEETWLVPAWNGEHALTNLYRYVEIEGKHRWIGTPTLGHGLFGPVEPVKKPDRVWLCEGLWDGTGWQAALHTTKRTPDGDLMLTSNSAQSVGAKSAVYAVPGVGSWLDNWHVKFADADVCLLFDNDHPDAQGRCAGYEGCKTTTSRLAFADKPPKGVWYMAWGDEGHDPGMPAGYDLRDLLKGYGPTHADRVGAVGWVTDKLKPVPDEWAQGRPKTKGGAPATADPLPCADWRTLVNQWRKAMQWPASGTGLDHGLAFMLAVSVSTMQAGDQLWGKVLGPASCGKSTLAEALSVARQYIHPVSTLTGFHSGYTDGDSSKDHSLVHSSNNKTLIVKDGDTLMKQGNVEQILSEARDIYDRVSRTKYRNGVERSYEDLSMTMIVCGTASLVSLDHSELGERFLNCVIMDGINLDNEKAVLRRVALGVVRNIDKDVRDKDDQDDPEKLKAKRLTAGYVCHLRENAKRLLTKVKEGVTDEVIDHLTDLGRYVACLRARPSSKQTEHTEREFAARLTSQLTRLGLCLAVVLNEPTITPNVLRRVSRAARDTARGSTHDLVKDLLEQPNGSKASAVAVRLNRKPQDVRVMLEFLRHIQVVETFVPQLTSGLKSSSIHWRVQKWFGELFNVVTAE